MKALMATLKGALGKDKLVGGLAADSVFGLAGNNIDVATGSVIKTLRAGLGTHGIAVSYDGRLAFASNIVEGTVSMIDLQSLTVSRTFAVGKGPNGITFQSDSDRPGNGGASQSSDWLAPYVDLSQS